MRLLLPSLLSHFYIPPNENATCNCYLDFSVLPGLGRVSSRIQYCQY
jgi:hypothetical protein